MAQICYIRTLRTFRSRRGIEPGTCPLDAVGSLQFHCTGVQEDKMTEKTTGGVAQKVAKAGINYFAPTIEKFSRRFGAAFANSTVIKVIEKQVSREALLLAAEKLPNFWSMLVGEIPDSAFLIPELADAFRGATTRFWEAYAHTLKGVPNPTPEQVVEAETKAFEAFDAYFDQMVKFDQLTKRFFHFADCPVVNGEFLPRGTKHHEMKYRAALDAGYCPGACCANRFKKADAEHVAETAPKADASKPQGPTKLPEGASVMDVLGAMLRSDDAQVAEIAKRLIAWLETLEKADFKKAEKLMREAFDTVEEAIALETVALEKRLDFLTAMQSRKKEKLGMIAKAKKELGKDFDKFLATVTAQLRAVDHTIVSEASYKKQLRTVARLRKERTSRHELPFWKRLLGLS
jgi:hypothetical protein